ncbi:ABC transporter permease [Roseomonas sp. BN140053]|uniref:ABC transporter permease n=1 Tax=Roseomonas sp. BN140053 TaxID=3391898 RepID=UPI0039EB3FF7
MFVARKLLDLLPGLAFIAAVILGLQQLSEAGLINRALFPPPSVIGSTVLDLLRNGDVAGPLGDTVVLFLAGFLLASLVAAVLGIAMGVSPRVNDLLNPLVEAIRPLPKAALVPVLILFLGLGAPMKITAVALAALFPVLINTVQGVRGVDPVLVATGRTFGRSRLAITLGIVVPASVPFILAGMRVALGLALLMTILSEMLAGTGGLGALVLENQRAFRIRQMYAWLVILAVLGLAINGAMLLAERRLAPWLEKFR